MRVRYQLTAIAISAAFTGSALAAVSAEEAKQLGGPVLTQFGAEKAGNKEGTIPAYTGTQVKAAPGWDTKKPIARPDPYGEKPLFAITAQNAAQYADKLDAMAEVFKRYPNFRMDVYPSHRNFVYPKYVLDNSVKNATSCKAVDNELILQGCYGGVAFPIPKTGNEVMWNRLTAFMYHRAKGRNNGYIVPISGSPVLVTANYQFQEIPFYDPANTGVNSPNGLIYRVHVYSYGPARTAGEQLVMLDPMDQRNVGRRAWQYIPGQRRVKLAPDLAYDTPSPYGGGAQTMDDNKIFLGALDRYDFKLIGKKEKYIPYDLFNSTDFKVCPPEKMLTKNFPNPDCLRWELHRVWVVQATLKPSFRHIYHKRMFFFDEDGYVAGQAEQYDAGGKLYRVNLGISYPNYEEQGPGGDGSANYTLDLQTGIWATQTISCDEGCGFQTTKSGSSEDKEYNPLVFSPESMAGGGIR